MLALCRKLEAGIIGRGRERDLGDPIQLTISLLGLMTCGALAPAAPAEETTETAREHQRAQPTGRKPLPESLPRVEVTDLPPEVEKTGTDAFEQIGEDVTERVERRRASLVVVRTHKPKFVAKNRDSKRSPLGDRQPAPNVIYGGGGRPLRVREEVRGAARHHCGVAC